MKSDNPTTPGSATQDNHKDGGQNDHCCNDKSHDKNCDCGHQKAHQTEGQPEEKQQSSKEVLKESQTPMPQSKNE